MIIAFSPPVSATKRRARGKVVRHRTADRLRRLRRSGEGHTVHAGVRSQRRPDRCAVARQELQDIAGDSGLVHRRDAKCAISGVCSAGFANTAQPADRAPAIWPVNIASGKFHGADAGYNPDSVAGKRGAGCVIAQEVNRFAQFTHCIERRLSRLARGIAKISPAFSS